MVSDTKYLQQCRFGSLIGRQHLKQKSNFRNSCKQQHMNRIIYVLRHFSFKCGEFTFSTHDGCIPHYTSTLILDMLCLTTKQNSRAGPNLLTCSSAQSRSEQNSIDQCQMVNYLQNDGRVKQKPNIQNGNLDLFISVFQMFA